MPFLKSPAVARILPFAVYILLLALDQPLSGLIASVGADARWLYAFRAGLAGLLLVWLWRHYCEFSWPADMPGEAWLASLLAGGVVFMVWIAPYPAWAAFAGSQGFSPLNADGSMDYQLAAIRVFGAALVVPLMEELFWRSYVMRWIDRADFLKGDPAQVGYRAFVLTAVMFALEHSLWLAGLLAGMVFNWLYKKYRNLWAPVVAHAVTNGMLGLWVLHTSRWSYW